MKRHSRYDLPGRGPGTTDWRDKVIHSPFMKKYGAFVAAAALIVAANLTKTDTLDMSSEKVKPETIENPIYQYTKQAITADTTQKIMSMDMTQLPLIR